MSAVVEGLRLSYAAPDPIPALDRYQVPHGSLMRKSCDASPPFSEPSVSEPAAHTLPRDLQRQVHRLLARWAITLLQRAKAEPTRPKL